MKCCTFSVVVKTNFIFLVLWVVRVTCLPKVMEKWRLIPKLYGLYSSKKTTLLFHPNNIILLSSFLFATGRDVEDKTGRATTPEIAEAQGMKITQRRK